MPRKKAVETSLPLPPIPPGPAQRAVKIKTDSYQLLLALVQQITSKGWSSVGSDRRDTVTQGAVIDQALRALQSRVSLSDLR